MHAFEMRYTTKFFILLHRMTDVSLLQVCMQYDRSLGLPFLFLQQEENALKHIYNRKFL